MTFVFQVVHRVTSLQEKGGFYWTSQRNLTMSCLNRLHPTDWFWAEETMQYGGVAFTFNPYKRSTTLEG